MHRANKSFSRGLAFITLLCNLAAEGQSIDMVAGADTDTAPVLEPRTLVGIDVDDGAQTLIGTPGDVIGINSMDFDRVTGALLGTDVYSALGTIFEIDRNNGVSTPIAMLHENGNPIPVGAIAFAPNGKLYAMAGFNTSVPHELGIVDLVAGTFSPILAFPAGRFYSGIDFTPDGMLYAVYSTFPGETVSLIDVRVPVVLSDIQPQSLAVGEIDFAADGFIYHSNYSYWLARMDPATGMQSLVGLGKLGALAGVASRGGLPNTARAGFIGEVTLIDVDTGAGQFAGRGVGSIFSGIFNYGTSELFASEIHTEANERDFLFLAEPYRSTLYDSATSASSLEVSINVQDNVVLSADEASLISSLTGQTVNEGATIDTWAVAALGIGAFEQDPDPNDQDDEELLYNGAQFDLVFIDLDGDLHSGLDYQPAPPAFADVDLVIFTVNEADASGELLYSALGVVSSSVDDGDDDGIGDLGDNCQLAANLDQVDSDGDGFGNACDSDLNNDCLINFGDLGLLKSVFFSSDPDADFNGDGTVNFGDLAIMKASFFAPPGPTALSSDCP